MKRQIGSMLIFMTVWHGCLAADEIRPLGEMDGFYRYTAVLGPLLADGHRLCEIPQWMYKTDFPYMKRPYAREIPFTDGLTVVRLLGGWEDRTLPNDRHNDPNDLVFRDETGVLHYRWNLLKERLDPFVANGYTKLTLVMDNVPWCLPGTPKQGNLGQVAPPDDYNEWYVFIRDMCRELKNFYGEETVNNFRFRMGTEMQDQRRFSGSLEEYLKYYDFAAKAVSEEIPGAGFGPFNRSMPMRADEKGNLPYDLVDILEVAKHCVTGTNYATGKIGAPMDFMARSFYYFSSQPEPGVFANIHPDQRTPEIGDLWRKIRSSHPALSGISREVQECGPHLSTEDGLYGLDTGARGAAQTLHTLINFKEEGADRIWHWELFEDIAEDKTLMLSQGWLYSILDYMRGGEMYVLPVDVSGQHGNTHKALISVQRDRAYLIVSCWNTDREKHATDNLRISVPCAVMPAEPVKIRALCFTERNSVYDILRGDLKSAALLSEKHLGHRGAPAAPAVTGGYHVMAADRNKGRDFINRNWPKYEQLMRDSLTLSDFSGTVSKTTGSVEVSFEAACPSVTALVFDLKRGME